MTTASAKYGLHRVLEGGDFETVIGQVRAALGTQGFGVLTEIDIQATMRAKLGEEYAAYTILGACHPPSAHAMLQEEPGIGLLLPCNVVVAQSVEGVVVSAVDPMAMVRVTDRPDLEARAALVRDMLLAALQAL